MSTTDYRSFVKYWVKILLCQNNYVPALIYVSNVCIPLWNMYKFGFSGTDGIWSSLLFPLLTAGLYIVPQTFCVRFMQYICSLSKTSRFADYFLSISVFILKVLALGSIPQKEGCERFDGNGGYCRSLFVIRVH